MSARAVRIGALLLLLGVAGCASTGRPPEPAGGVSLPAGAHILPADKIPDMLEQCSREAPAPGEGSWTPDAASIRALEALLPARLAQRWPDRDWSGFPGQWIRQYVGILRGGRRFLYGNIVPADIAEEAPGAESEAVNVCDGGPSLFGAEYDVAAGAISHIAFNGRY